MRTSEQRFCSLFVSTAVGVALLSGKGTIKTVNQALCRMLGREEPQLIGQSFFRSVTFEDPESIKVATQAMRSGKPESF